jgi:hypothetical protein
MGVKQAEGVGLLDKSIEPHGRIPIPVTQHPTHYVDLAWVAA